MIYYLSVEKKRFFHFFIIFNGLRENHFLIIFNVRGAKILKTKKKRFCYLKDENEKKTEKKRNENEAKLGGLWLLRYYCDDYNYYPYDCYEFVENGMKTKKRKKNGFWWKRYENVKTKKKTEGLQTAKIGRFRIRLKTKKKNGKTIFFTLR